MSGPDRLDDRPLGQRVAFIEGEPPSPAETAPAYAEIRTALRARRGTWAKAMQFTPDKRRQAQNSQRYLTRGHKDIETALRVIGGHLVIYARATEGPDRG